MFTKEDKKIMSKGGKRTFEKYGSEYMKMIGRKGGRPRKKLSTSEGLRDKPSML